MKKKNFFFKSSFIQSKEFYKNLNKTKKVFKSLLLDIDNLEIPLLESFQKEYEFGFSKNLIKKFSRYKNIIVIGMGGSILGTKSIYSFLKRKVKKEVFFFYNLDANLNLKFKKIKYLNNY